MEGGGGVKSITGLSSDEQTVVDALSAQLAAKRSRNRLRSAYMDAKHVVRKLPPAIPPYLRTLAMVLGWPSKAVEALARRARLVEFAIPGSDGDPFGIGSIVDDNWYYEEARLAGLASLEHSVSWLVTTRGDVAAGDPAALITTQDAINGTGEWSRRARRLVSFLSVVEYAKHTGEPTDFNLFLPGQTVVVQGSQVVDRAISSLPRIPVEPLVYRKRPNRPFGSSRITRPIMQLTDSAVRSILRSEGTADFYSAPILALLGPDQSIFEGNPALKMLLSSMFAIPDNEDADTPRADIKQFQQASQTPHVDQLEVWAQLFAAEAGIPVSSLGIGMTQANPTSAESYLASREDLISEAEDVIDGWAPAHIRTVQNAWMIREGASDVPAELRDLKAVFRDPRHESKAAAADWFLKVASAMPWVAESDVAVEMIGLDDVTVERLQGERARVRARAAIDALAGSGVNSNAG